MTPGLDTTRTLHVRCGSDIRRALEIAGFEGEFLEFADPFCQGPVPRLPLAGFIAARASFVSSAYGLDEHDTLTRMKKEYQALSHIGEYEQVVFWFEHDAYDQLILAFLLYYLSGTGEALPLELICVDSVPGISRFIGVGQLAPEALRLLWEHKRATVTGEQLELGRIVWEAYSTTNLDRLEDLSRGTPAVPCMANALKRQLQELPSTHNGLGLTQQLVLEMLADSGPLSGGKLFHILMTEKEPLPFLGDQMFWYVLDDMGRTRLPLYQVQDELPWPKRKLSITETGEAVLAGTLDYLEIYESERWVGASKITAGSRSARWDTRTGSVRATT